jgi:hypothetical protein
VVEEGSAFPVKGKAKSSHTHLHHLLQGQHHDGRRHKNTVILHPARCEVKGNCFWNLTFPFPFSELLHISLKIHPWW